MTVEQRRQHKVRGFWLIWPVLAILAYFGQRLLAKTPSIVEYGYSRTVFHVLIDPFIWLNSLVPLSLMEILLVTLAIALVTFFILWLVRLIRQPDKLKRFGRLLRRLAWVASILYLAFMLLHGLNYARLPVATTFNLPVEERGMVDLEATATWLIDQCNQLRPALKQDGEGLFQLSSGTAAALRSAANGFVAAAKEYPLLAGPAIRPKGLLSSHWVSYTGTAGIYFPFLAEADVNIDMPDYQIPAAALHEIAHTRGFAREDEAGFLAFLAGLDHPDADFAYSVLLDAAVRCTNEIYAYDPKIYDRLIRSLDAGALRDLSAGSRYWKQFEGPVQTTSTKINDVYLQTNLQNDGVRSYGRMLDLVLTWYEQHQAAGTLDQAVASLAGATSGAAAGK
jgi:hypothetical protein